MGNAASDFRYLGSKINDGWNSLKSFGNKVWNGIKSVPVLGTIAGGIEKYTPIGWAATNALKGIDAGIGAGSKLLQGDLNGAVKTGIDYGRQAINQENPLITEARKIPVIGGLVDKAKDIAESVPVPVLGMSIKDARAIGNTALNSADAFRQGDWEGGLKNAANVGVNVASKGLLGDKAKSVANFANKANDLSGKRIF
jgi:hypothetical protein